MKSILKSDCEFEKTSQLLENNYVNIFKSLNDEGYVLQYDDFDTFTEIIDEGEVAGFYTLELFDNSNMVLNECYILKEHRGKNLLANVLFELLSKPHGLFIRNPNSNMINTLLKHKLAIKCDGELIYSSIPFFAKTDELYVVPKLKKFYRKNIGDKFILASYYYDNSLKSFFTFEPESSDITKHSEIIIVFEPRKSDIKKYKLRKKLKNITLKYSRHIYGNIFYSDENKVLVQNQDMEVFKRVLDYNSVDNIIGSESELTDSMVELLDENNLKKEDAFKIRRNVLKAIETDDLAPMQARTRINYLISNPSKIDFEPDMNLLPDKCPFCENDFNPLFTCDRCGFSTDIDNVEKAIERNNLGEDGLLYRELADKIDENSWDYDEVFNTQCLFGVFEFILMSSNDTYLPIEDVDRSNRLKSGCVAKYALENEYLNEVSYDKYIDIIENEYDTEMLIREAVRYGLQPESSKKKLIEQIKKEVKPGMQSIKYFPTEKGSSLVQNSPEKHYFLSNLPTFIFYEFEKYLDEHDYSLEESGDKFVEYQFEKGMENKDWSVYKKLLKFKISNENNTRKLCKLAVQILIYDINGGSKLNIATRDIDEFDVEMDTLFYLDEYVHNFSPDEVEEIFEEAFDEFRVDELKNNKEKAYNMLMELFR